MRINRPTSELEGLELDCAVATSSGVGLVTTNAGRCFVDPTGRGQPRMFSPSTDWTACRELLIVTKADLSFQRGYWTATIRHHRSSGQTRYIQRGATPEIALCRAVVNMMLGAIVNFEVPVV